MKMNKSVVVVLSVVLCVLILTSCKSAQVTVNPTEETFPDVVPTEDAIPENSIEETAVPTEQEAENAATEGNADDLLADVGEFSGEWAEESTEANPTELEGETEEEQPDPTEIPDVTEPAEKEPADDQEDEASENVTEPTVTAGNDNTLGALGDVPEY